ncbi:hypothetical protein J4437_00995 [Candidatus Woesearchaeota archaeon]|nr:hypothetical protein [Candidatus Woesearchaeota archaeon]
MRIIDASKGRQTDTSTGFGRHYHVFQTLKEELRKRNDLKSKTLECLIIGPGLRYTDYDQRYINTYQPFELANALRYLEWQADILDINTIVINELKKRPAKLNISKKYWENYHHIQEFEDRIGHQARYYDQFFENHKIEGNDSYKIVEIPDEILNRFNLIQGDIVQDQIKNYDIIICTVVLSYYQSSFTHDESIPFNTLPNKIISAVNKGGYLIASFSQNADFELLGYSANFSYTSVHNEAASLSKRI